MSEANSIVSYRPIPGFPGYRVGDDGSVWSCWSKNPSKRRITDRWKRMRLSPASKGYLRVTLTPSDGTKVRGFRVHRLILLAFVGPSPEGMECRHFPDTTKTNNRLENLSWGTPAENYDDNRRMGVYSNRPYHLMFTHQGKTLNLKDWAKEVGLPYLCLYQRVRHAGIPFEEAISRPIRKLRQSCR